MGAKENRISILWVFCSPVKSPTSVVKHWPWVCSYPQLIPQRQGDCAGDCDAHAEKPGASRTGPAARPCRLQLPGPCHFSESGQAEVTRICPGVFLQEGMHRKC